MGRQRTTCAVAAAGLCLLLAGCLGTGDVTNDLRARRLRRFETWKADRSAPRTERPRLEGPLSLERCILLGLANSRELQIALRERDKASARVTEAWAEALPKIDLRATYTRLDEVASFGVGGRTISLGDKNVYNLATDLRQPLYRGGAIGAGIRAARYYASLTDQTLRGTYQRVIFDVRKAYYDARLALELERASAEAVRVARQHLEDVRKDRAAGTASDFDVLRAEVELKNLLAQQVKDQNQYRLAVATLLNVIGVSQDSKVEITDPLVYRPIQPDMEEAVRRAFLQHPDILEAELWIRVQNEALKAARSGLWPEVDAVLTGTYSRPDPHSQTRIEWGEAWNAGLALTYHLFEGFRTWARIKQERLTLQQRKIELRDTEERILLDIHQALLSLEDAARFVESQEANVQQAQEALRLAQVGFRQGVRKEVEVLDARRALTLARANYARAVYDHEMARLRLELATGTLEPPAEGGP